MKEEIVYKGREIIIEEDLIKQTSQLPLPKDSGL